MRNTNFTSKALSAAMAGTASIGLRSLCAVALIAGLAACGSSGSLRSDLGPDGTWRHGRRNRRRHWHRRHMQVAVTLEAVDGAGRQPQKQ